MSYQDHLRTCSDCQKKQRPTIKVKGASSYRREKKMAELMSVIKGTSYSSISYPESSTKSRTKAASSISWVEKSQKLKELGKLVRG